ncbi:carbohydrate-binding module family 1 protein [Sporormia fimetaria CBS 119925]|uniref:Carbohydrate-binding module family 1 protein n=1 Tax=Sporormia fimetaria CBS 119925 TaxID=1340428 RepID=A0A6A6UXF8_9PLEO|nr:carbohydrate-binding module family 1 protein [Sporormia fimetaria CBS 119925]
MKVPAAAAALSLSGLVAGNPVELTERQSCPNVYVFGARETTAPVGYGTSQGLVNQVVAAYPGAGSEAISYPACGGQSSCGGISYDNSASQGTAAVVRAVTSYNQRCPNTQIVLIGYSQGGQIMDNALCGGAGATLTGAALNAVKAAIFLGDPHYRVGLPYNVGTCQAQGFAARPAGFVCSPASSDRLKSYCDSTDPYCCTGNDANSHQQYVNKYGSQALAFIKSKLSSTGGGNPVTSSVAPPAQTSAPPAQTSAPPNNGGGSGCSVVRWAQCGGQGWTGCTVCASGSTCQAANQWYSQCL